MQRRDKKKASEHTHKLLLSLMEYICHLHGGLATPSSSASLDLEVKMGAGGSSTWFVCADLVVNTVASVLPVPDPPWLTLHRVEHSEPPAPPCWGSPPKADFRESKKMHEWWVSRTDGFADLAAWEYIQARIPSVIYFPYLQAVTGRCSVRMRMHFCWSLVLNVSWSWNGRTSLCKKAVTYVCTHASSVWFFFCCMSDVSHHKIGFGVNAGVGSAHCAMWVIFL